VKTASSCLGKCIAAGLFLFMSILITVTFLQVLFRFVLRIPAVWTEEVARMSFVWLIFLGAAIAVKEGGHLALDMITAAMPPRVRTVMQYWVLTLILALSGIILYAGGNYCLRSAGKVAVTLPIPSNCVYLAVPISAAMMIFFSLELIADKMFAKEGTRP
jgi:TRAP-type C4-dicarboxylate transport system permease small subunit